jgi:hypothetical protein
VPLNEKDFYQLLQLIRRSIEKIYMMKRSSSLITILEQHLLASLAIFSNRNIVFQNKSGYRDSNTTMQIAKYSIQGERAPNELLTQTSPH